MKMIQAWWVSGVAVLVLGSGVPGAETPEGVTVREGYELSIAADGIERARFMELGPDGTLYVSQPHAGQIQALRDPDGDGVYDQRTVFVEDYPTAHAMQWHDGALWFTQSQAIHRAKDSNGDGKADQVEQVLGKETLPGGSGHWWRSLLIHNGRIYTSVGDSGNIKDETETKRQKIWSYALDGSDEKLFSSGIRNTEKLVARPGTEEVWGMDHGSDWFGRVMEEDDPGKRQPITDLNPPGEMNHYREGEFYGHPFVVDSRIPRYEYMDREDIVELAAKTVPPAWETGAHWAPNAMEFYTADQFPEAKGDAFVAFHGSWNRSSKAGYCVSRVLFEEGKPYGELVYVSFLGEDNQVLGRPVDCQVAPDGSLLISDDHGGRIYRLRYRGE